MTYLNKLLIISSFFFFFFFFGCSTPTFEFKESSINPYKGKDLNKIFSPDSVFFVKMPKDWFETKFDSDSKNLILVKENYFFVMEISEIKIFADIKKISLEEQFLSLTKMSFGLKKRRFSNSFKLIASPDLFFFSSKKYCEYQFKFNKEQIGRVIVYTIKDRFFEVFVFSTNKIEKIETKDIDEIFSIQQSILESFRFTK